MGPLVTREHRDKVAGYLDAAREQGATVVRDGREDAAFSGDGFFLGVSLIDDVKPAMTATATRSSARCSAVVRAILLRRSARLVNDNPYGNGVAIFTRDGGVARQFQFDVNVGMVGVNVPIPVPVVVLLVRRLEGLALRRPAHVRTGRHELLHPQKVVTSRWPDPATSRVDLGFPRTR